MDEDDPDQQVNNQEETVENFTMCNEEDDKEEESAMFSSKLSEVKGHMTIIAYVKNSSYLNVL